MIPSSRHDLGPAARPMFLHPGDRSTSHAIGLSGPPTGPEVSPTPWRLGSADQSLPADRRRYPREIPRIAARTNRRAMCCAMRSSTATPRRAPVQGHRAERRAATAVRHSRSSVPAASRIAGSRTLRARTSISMLLRHVFRVAHRWADRSGLRSQSVRQAIARRQFSRNSSPVTGRRNHPVADGPEFPTVDWPRPSVSVARVVLRHHTQVDWTDDLTAAMSFGARGRN